MSESKDIAWEQFVEMLGKSVKTVARALDSLKKKGESCAFARKNGHREIGGGNDDGK